MGLCSSDDVALGGAIVGTYPMYAVRVAIPALAIARRVRAVAVSDTACPAGMVGSRVFGFSARSPTATLATDVSLGWRFRDRKRYGGRHTVSNSWKLRRALVHGWRIHWVYRSIGASLL